MPYLTRNGVKIRTNGKEYDPIISYWIVKRRGEFTYEEVPDKALQSPVKDGYGYYGVLLYAPEIDRVQCHICGLWFKKVANHTAMLHGMDRKEYAEVFRLGNFERLSSLEMKKVYGAAARRRRLWEHSSAYHDPDIMLTKRGDCAVTFRRKMGVNLGLKWSDKSKKKASKSALVRCERWHQQMYEIAEEYSTETGDDYIIAKDTKYKDRGSVSKSIGRGYFKGVKVDLFPGYPFWLVHKESYDKWVAKTA